MVRSWVSILVLCAIALLPWFANKSISALVCTAFPQHTPMVFRYQTPQIPSPPLFILSLSGTKEGGAWIIHLLFNRCFLKFAEVLHESLPTVASNTDVTPIAHLYAAGSMMGSYWSAHEVRNSDCNPLKAEDGQKWVWDWDSCASERSWETIVQMHACFCLGYTTWWVS